MTLALRRYPRFISHLRYARNNFVPEAPFARRLINGQNHVMAFRRKTFLNASALDGRFAGAAGETILYRSYFHTGHGATGIKVKVGIGSDNLSSGVDPIVRFKLTKVSGGSADVYLHAGNHSGSADDSPSAVTWRDGIIPCDADADYYIDVVATDYARVLSVCVWEAASDIVNEATNYYVDPDPTVGFPIWDSMRQKQLVGMSQIWRRNAGQIMTWPGPGTGSGLTRTGVTTWLNAIDGSSTSVTASTPGFWLGDDEWPLDRWQRYSDAIAGLTINVVFACYASCTGSATGEVKLENSTGTICSITGMGTAAAWYTSATTLANWDPSSKADLMYRTSNAANTVTIHAACLYAYLA